MPTPCIVLYGSLKGKEISLKKSKNIPTVFAVMFLITVCCTAFSAMPHKDETLKKTEYLISSGSLIGKNIDVCKEYWEEESVIYKSTYTDRKAFYAGCVYQKVFGMSDHQHYYVVVYYKNNIITELEILPYKNG